MSELIEISALVVRERQSRVRRQSAELLACFHEDATIEASWMRGSVAAFAAAGEHRSPDEGLILNRLGPPVVDVNGRRAFVQLPSTTIRWIPVNGTEAILSAYMRALYRVEQRGEGDPWKISSLSAVNEGDTLEPAVPGTDLHIDPDDLVDLRSSYRFMAYTRALSGVAVSPDLLGTDRPEQLEAVYADAAAWLQE